jgi:hypothetical protein
LLRLSVLVGLIIAHSRLMGPDLATQASAQTLENYPTEPGEDLCEQECNSLLTATVSYGLTLIVTNTNDDLNGHYWDPAELIANPGPDGISFREAMKSIWVDNGVPETITFDPSLSGSVISAAEGLDAIIRDGLTIDGDLNDDGVPDITIDGDKLGSGLWLWGASHVVIEGLVLRNFSKHGIAITNGVQEDTPVTQDVVVRNNIISNMRESGVFVGLWEVDEGSIRNIEIVDNVIVDNGSGISIEGGAEDCASDNATSDVLIIHNTIVRSGSQLGVTVQAAGGVTGGLAHNTVSDVRILGNDFVGGRVASVLIGAANRNNCTDNTVSGIEIAHNYIDAAPVTIEIVSVGENGSNNSGNRVQDITIKDNVLTGGGIQIGGATGYNAYDNTISGILVERNHISSCANNGIYLVAGESGAHDNLIENTVIRDTFIGDCTDTGVLIHGESASSPNNTIDGVTVANLTIVDNGIGSAWAGGFNINSRHASNIISNVVISNTILWGNNFSDGVRGSLVPESVTYSILNDVRFTGTDGNIYLSPEFVDPAARDYHLEADSPCVDTGDPSGLHIGVRDLDGRVRPWDGDGDTVTVVDRGAWEHASVLAQQIDLRGNSLSIVNGDAVPVAWDGTDFGIVAVPEGTVERTYTIRNSGGLSLTLTADPKVAVTGTHAADFVVTAQPQSPVAAGESTTFTVTFSPTAGGVRSATIHIGSDDIDENPYSFSIQGTGAFTIHLPLGLR